MIPHQQFSPLAYFKKTLKPNLPLIVDVHGTMFRVKEAPKQFFVKFDQGSRFPIECGLGIGFNNGDFFKRLELTNENAEDLEVEFYVGSADVIDSRLNSRFDRDNPVSVKEAPTFITGNKVTIAAASWTIIPYRSARGQQRKQLVIYNDSNIILHISAANDSNNTLVGEVLGKIPVGASYTLFTSASVGVLNPDAVATKDIRYLETVYF